MSEICAANMLLYGQICQFVISVEILSESSIPSWLFPRSHITTTAHVHPHSHVAMATPHSHISMATPHSHISMATPHSHVTMATPHSHVTMATPLLKLVASKCKYNNVRVFVFSCVRVDVCIHVYVHVCVCVYVCMCVWHAMIHSCSMC